MMSKVPFVDLAAQYAGIKDEVDEAISRVVQSTAYILGKDVGLFEQEFADYCQAKHAIGVDSGTSALELALRAVEIGPGDEVIVPANTFIATALAVAYTGATPVLVEPDPNTHTIDVSAVERAIGSKTKAILPVHLYGQAADMEPLMRIAQQHSLLVIEDACQAHGARYKGVRVGSIGHIGAFSFYPAKNLGAYGDGGMVVTNDEAIATCVRQLRDYGQTEKYYHARLGYNRRLDTLQAAVLRVKLKYLDGWNQARRTAAQIYGRLLADKRVTTPKTPDYSEPVWHLYVIQSADRESLRSRLAQRGISTGIHYPIPIHLQPAFAFLGWSKGDFPITESIADRCLSLPMYPELTADLVQYVATSIGELV
jgi:dTDP-4-amino-4,6-dideoxygalactose transaminase